MSQGPGWWQASDGNWYAPELHPDFLAAAAGDTATPAAQSGDGGGDRPAPGGQGESGGTPPTSRGWWQASDENWYPPEMHPDALRAVAERAASPDSTGGASAPMPEDVVATSHRYGPVGGAGQGAPAGHAGVGGPAGGYNASGSATGSEDAGDSGFDSDWSLAATSGRRSARRTGRGRPSRRAVVAIFLVLVLAGVAVAVVFLVAHK